MKILFKHDSGGFAILITKQQLTIMKKVVFLKRSSIHSQSFIHSSCFTTVNIMDVLHVQYKKRIFLFKLIRSRTRVVNRKYQKEILLSKHTNVHVTFSFNRSFTTSLAIKY